MILTRNRRLAFGLGLAMAFSSASAVEAGWYIGVNAGTSTTDVDQAELDSFVDDAFFFAGAPIISGSSTLDDAATTWSIVGGYRFNSYLAIEASYLDLGTAEYRASGLVDPPGPVASAPMTFGIDFASTGFTTAAVGSLPLGESFDLHARLGIFFSETKITFTGGDGSFNESDSISGSDTDVFYGAGLSWHVGSNWTFGLDYQLYQDVGSEDETDETDIDSVTLLGAYRF